MAWAYIAMMKLYKIYSGFFLLVRMSKDNFHMYKLLLESKSLSILKISTGIEWDVKMHRSGLKRVFR